MSDRISSRSIYHFTNTLSKLIYIIKNGFMPRCCIEIRENKKIAIPMVSFCDIPLSDIDFHIEKYGYYGIGLSKKWAIKNGITPIMYQATFQGSNKNYNSIIEIVNSLNDEPEKVDLLKERLIYFSWFIKNYEGENFQDGKVIEFYNEREWRYIPKFDKLLSKELNPSLFSSNVESIGKEFNKKFSSYYKLTFNPDDIKYIIIRNEKELATIFDVFDELGEQNESKILNAVKILTIDNILNDF